uniref:CCHC-type domain-containing protein n=1 Tax=Populus davidiana TaxID=266767 RepID=A0A6M2F1K5_9ROSI
MKKKISASDKKLKGEVQPKHNHDIKGFKCQGLGHYASECANHRVMTLRDDGEIVSTSEESDCNDMPPLEDASDLKYPVSDKVLVIRRRMMWSNKGRTSSMLDA